MCVCRVSCSSSGNDSGTSSSCNKNSTIILVVELAVVVVVKVVPVVIAAAAVVEAVAEGLFTPQLTESVKIDPRIKFYPYPLTMLGNPPPYQPGPIL